MTRPILAVVTAISIMGLSACDTGNATGQASGPAATGWTTAPAIQTAAVGADSLTLRGQAAPGARIVLRAQPGVAYAVGADDEGRFDIRIRRPDVDTLFVVETQVGQDAAPAPGRLLVSRDPGGPVALIAPGVPTVRLDPGQGLDVIDSDGRTRVASGRAPAGTRIGVAVEGGAPREVTANAQGRWTLDLGSTGNPPLTVSVAGVTHVYPGDGRGETDAVLEDVGAGKALRWSLSPTSRQTSWFLNRSR